MPELNFKGKEFVYNHHLAIPFRPLIPDAKKSVGKPHLDGNLIIHGDNLHALKTLLPMYAGKVDCIFIDPPYNTGKENWNYNDNVNSPMIREWLSGNPVTIEDGLRHDKWCAMMYPRLRLLQELLADTGSIWITLDHNEAHHTRSMLDEIFGEKNFLAQISWEKVYSPRMDAKGFSFDFDQVLVYAKDKNEVMLAFEIAEQNASQFTYTESETGFKARLRSLRKEGSASLRTDRENCWYGIEAPDGTFIYPVRPDGREGRWRWEEPTYLREKAKSLSKVLIQKNLEGKWEVWVKQYFKGKAERPISTIFKNSEYGHTHEAAEEIKRIFGDAVFSTPKPTSLISGILDLGMHSDGIVLDSFAGSGTTAHAVLAANEKDGGSRKFILVECEDYADKLTAERVRRVIKGYSFQGIHKEELLKERITWTTFSRERVRQKLLDQIQSVKNMDGPRFDLIKCEIVNGELIVTGQNEVKERIEGLGGAFTYCTLGEPLDLDRVLTGEMLPAFEALGALLFHMATNEAFNAKRITEKDGVGYLGESQNFHVWLIYKPDLNFLKSREAALTLARAKYFASKKTGKRHLVFAPARFVSQKMLNEYNLPVEFAPLPFALYRIERG